MSLAALASSAGRAPGPRGHWLLGSLPDSRRDPLAFLTGLAREHGDVARFRLGPLDAHLVSHPAGIRQVLVDNARNYGKHLRGFEGVRAFLGQGLLTSDGSFWLRQRRIAQPAFHKKRIAGFATQMARAAEDMARRWEFARGPIDVAAEMSRLTLRVVGEALLSADVTAEADKVGQALPVLLRHGYERFTNIFSLPESVPTPHNLRFKEALRAVDEVVYALIAERRQTSSDPGDLLSMLMQARDDDGQGMTDLQLRDEVITIFLAGHETTANALAWTWMLLAEHPWAGERLRGELAATLGGRAPGMEHLAMLPWTTSVLHESMRLYPPAWLFGRNVLEDDRIGGYTVSAGSFLFVSPYVTHRHPGLWREPERFDPDRFGAEIDRFAYLPFGGGPRQCIGNSFAMMEAQIIVATVAQRFRLHKAPWRTVEIEPSLTLRPRDGLWMEAERLA